MLRPYLLVTLKSLHLSLVHENDILLQQVLDTTHLPFGGSYCCVVVLSGKLGNCWVYLRRELTG